MRLLLSQLVYTSFSGIGFKTLASPEIPPEIKRAFQERVISEYWNAYNPPKSGYRAAYLHQVTPEHTLFGWLYNDGTDDIGRGDVPCFICYYLPAPLLEFELENLFTCLQKGPLTQIDRRNYPNSLDTIVVKDVRNYQPTRSGVMIPIAAQKQSLLSLQRGQVIDLFVPLEELEVFNNFTDRSLEYKINNPIGIQSHIVEEIATIKEQKNLEPSTEIVENITTNSSFRQFMSERIKIQEIITSKTIDKIIINSSGDRLDNKHIEAELITDLPDVTNLPTANKTQRLLLIGIVASALALAASIAAIVQQVGLTGDRSPTSATVHQAIAYKSFAEVPNVPPGLFYYGGSTTFAPLRFSNLVSAINQAHPQFKLRYAEALASSPDLGPGIGMLLSGEISFVQSSRPLNERELYQAKARGFELLQIPVAIDAVVFYVNPQISIPGLNLSQVRDIFTGQITNWKQVGGPDLAISLFHGDPEANGTVDLVKTKVLDGREFEQKLQIVKTPTESIQKVAQTPGGMGFTSAAQVVGQSSVYPLALSLTNSPDLVSPVVGYYPQIAINKAAFTNGSYPLTRKLFLIIKKDEKTDEQAGMAYANFLLSEEGQKYIDLSGFAPIGSK
jgi:phosphate transport system substrate-binding protein